MIYQISSGQGPAECELAVAKFLAYLQENYDISVVDTSAGYYDETYRSVRLFSEDDLSEYVGSVKWVCPSPYRPDHKRKTGLLTSAPAWWNSVPSSTLNRSSLRPFAAAAKAGRM